MGKDNEASLPVAARVSVKSLAELDVYWSSEGYSIRTMSQLVAWSLDLLCSILEANNKTVPIETFLAAHRRLELRGLYQKSYKDRSFKKIGTAMRFESMREDGIEPATYAPEQDRVVNRTNAVKPMPAEARASYVSPYEADYKKSEEMAAVELQKQKAEEMQRMIDAGVVADDPESMRNRERITREARQAPQQAPPEIYRKRGPTIWDLEKREKEQLAELNRPIGELIEEMKKMGNVVQEKPEKKE